MLPYHLLLLLALSWSAAVETSNLHRPKIWASAFKKTLYRNLMTKWPIGRIQVFDRDTGEAARVHCQVNVKPSGTFDLVEMSKDIYVLKMLIPLGREQESVMKINITCTDRGKPPLSSTEEISFQVLDVNGSAPVFLAEKYVFEIPENVPLLQTVGQVSVKNTTRIMYSLTGDLRKSFTIDQTGRLFTSRDMDREAISKYSGTVVAKYMGHNSLAATAQLTIKLVDVNDNSPVFQQKKTKIELLREIPIGVPFFRLQAYDRDEGANGEVRYFIVNDPTKRFRVDNKTGDISVSGSLMDFPGDVVKLRVSAKDMGSTSRARDSMVFIFLRDLTKRRKLFFNKTHYYFTIKENVSIVGQVKAYVNKGRNDSVINYQLDITGKQFFTINRYSGLIRRRNISLENATGIGFVVTAWIGELGNFSFMANTTFYVNVTKETKLLPQISFHYRFWIKENEPVGTKIGQIEASGADKIRYRLDGNSTLWLRVDNETGILSTAAVLDREVMDQVRATVTAVGRTGVSASTSIVVDIQDVNDCIPRFPENFTIVMKEGGHDTTPLPQIRAFDCDVSSPNNNVSYRLLDSPFSKHFQLLADGSLLLKNGTFDREELSTFNVTLVGTDGGSPNLSSSVLIIVNVVDINDNNPVWKYPVSSNTTVKISVKSPAGSIISTVKAVDADAGQNGEVFYFMETFGLPFVVSRKGGEIRTTRALTKKDIGRRDLVVMASDFGSPKRRALVVLKIVIE